MHLLIDGYGGNAGKMEDKDFLLRFLYDYPTRLGMNRISTPSVLHYTALKPEDSGVSGFVIIAESHISVHTFPYKRYINIDIFSCVSFDFRQALTNIQQVFELDRVKHWVVDRGLEHYDPDLAIETPPRDLSSPMDDPKVMQ